MKNNKWFCALMIVVLVLAIASVAYYLGQKSKTESPVTEENNLLSEDQMVNQDCSAWLTYHGAYTVEYPNCWVASDIKGGSIGSANSNVGVLLRPLISSSPIDSISIGGWQNDCNNTSPGTKGYCLKQETYPWVGQYMTTSNIGTMFGIPMTTQTTNAQVLDMFDQIVKHNTQAGCLPDTTPWIKILSPNGGETYIAGQQVTIKWESCNIKTGFEQIALETYPHSIGVIQINPAGVSVGSGVLNWTIPLNVDVTKKHTIYLETGMWQQGVSEYSPTDESDNYFTINRNNLTTNLRKLNETCGESIGNCEAGLKCAYPCGIEGCQNVCLPEDSLPRP